MNKSFSGGKSKVAVIEEASSSPACPLCAKLQLPGSASCILFYFLFGGGC